MTIATDVADVLNAYDKVSSKRKYLSEFVGQEQEKAKKLMDAATFYKLKSERCGRIAKDWLSSAKGGAFMAKLSGR